MTKRFVPPMLAAALIVSPAAAQTGNFEGHWANPKHSTIVNVSRCDGDYFCAVVLKASAKAQANARKGGTMHFIGTEILRVRPAGDGTFKGTAFDPETNMHVSATVKVLGPDEMEIRGCALLGLVCEAQRWTKVS
ncbi:MAG TPA: DUF2147 domain-containing protein [Sphingomicrobium sp.]|nr:DUF2147 domain-containing protein [Sphingomicrobium sp.]